jgi:hypothetical protein
MARRTAGARMGGIRCLGAERDERGERYLAPVVTDRLMARSQQPARMSLTERELGLVVG